MDQQFNTVRQLKGQITGAGGRWRGDLGGLAAKILHDIAGQISGELVTEVGVGLTIRSIKESDQMTMDADVTVQADKQPQVAIAMDKAVAKIR